METNKKKCIVYVDGFNWYHAIFKHRPELKWLNVQSYFESIRLDDNVVAIKIFSALIREPLARERQEKYFKAISSFPKVRIILGQFQPREVTCRSVCKQKYLVDEEKKTDVNLAVELLSDVVNLQADRICVVSGDSDVQPAVEWVAKNRPSIKINVYIPALPADPRRSDYYRQKGLNVDCRFLPIIELKNHQLPHNVKLADKTFCCRPESWS